MAASLSGPSVSADGSLNLGVPWDACADAGAGDGVAGGFVEAEAAGRGAAGADGVCTCVCTGAGVDGAALLDGPAAAAFG